MKTIWVKPSDPAFEYTGRIDQDDKDAPVLVYACSSIGFRISGSHAALVLENKRAYFENSVGIVIDGRYRGKILLHDGVSLQGDTFEQYLLRLDRESADALRQAKKLRRITVGGEKTESADAGAVDGENIVAGGNTGNGENARVYDLTPFLDGEEHEILIFKRMDACHYVTFLGVLSENGAVQKTQLPRPARRIEVYGDSVSCGEVSEAIGRCGSDDPEGHNGIYSNSFYSYPWILARKLGAAVHDISQGGISLLDGEGYFDMPDTKGMLSCFDKINYNPSLGDVKTWDFSKYQPHVVIIAIGQNDHHPVNYMPEDYHSEKSVCWRKMYRHFIEELRRKYPKALILLTTTILGHEKEWDDAIDEVAKELNDPKVKHFLYSNNGCGTSGHIRIPEAEKMAEELQDFLEKQGEEIWED